VRGHVLLCLLAYYVEWRTRQALAPVLFDATSGHLPLLSTNVQERRPCCVSAIAAIPPMTAEVRQFPPVWL
jgi:hypothetical protein